MLYPLSFNFRKITILSFTVASLCLFSEVSFAQEDMAKVEIDMIKSVDKSNSDSSPSANETNSSVPILKKSVVTSPKTNAPKKDSGLVGEGKKPESTPSSLNFNIFLYIVDKFKAD